MSDPAESSVQNLLPVQAYFDAQGDFQTFIGQNKPFYATTNPEQSGLHITDSTIDSTTIGATTPSTGVFTNISTTTGQISTAPSGNTDIVNKQYVDAIAQGLNPKQAVKCATTVSITLSGLQTIDTYTTLAGDRVLVKNQSTSAENGIYIATSGAWTRASDMDVWSEVPGAYTVILNGSQGQTGWVCTAADTGTIGVTAMPWVQFSGSATYYAGTGLTLAANTFSITNTGVTAATKGSASKTVTATVNAQGQLTSLTDQDIAIAGTQITSGTIDSARLSGSYTGITGVGTLTAGTWNASTIDVTHGGTGATTLTGYVKGSGTSALTASSTIPNSDITGLGTMSTQDASSVAITGGSAALGTLKTLGLTGYLYGNDTSAVTASTTIPNTAITGLGSMSTQNANNVAITGGYATGLTNLGADYLQLNTGATVTPAIGRVWWDGGTTMNMGMTANVTSHVSEDTFFYVKASGAITKGQLCSFTGVVGASGVITAAPAGAGITNADYIVGVAAESIASGSFGLIQWFGTLRGFDTSAWVDGDILYYDPAAGGFTKTYPTSGIIVTVAAVINAGPGSSGSILIRPTKTQRITGGSGISVTQTTAGSSVAISSPVSIANGGTNGTATPTAGGIAYGSGTAYAFSSAGTSGQVLTSNGSSAPTWTTPTAYATVTDDTTTNATRYPLFANQTTGNLATEYTSSTKFQYNPSTGTLTASVFSGAGTSLTGTASGLSIGGNAATATSATTATNLAGGANGSVPYQTGSGATTMLAAGSNGQILTLAGGVPTWAAAPVTGVTITDDTTTNATRYLTFTSSTTGTITGENVSSTKLQYNPSTGVLSSTSFSGAGTGLTGTASSLSIGGNAATVTNGVYTSGSYADPTWITSLAGSKVSGNISGNAANVTGTVAVANGGSGQTTAQAAMNTFAGAVTSGSYLRGNGTNVVMSTIQAADVPTLNQNTTGSSAKWTTARTESLTGDVTGSASVDGSANWSVATTLATVNSNVGTFTKVTVNGKGLTTAASQASLSDLSSPTSSFSFNSQNITNLLDPVNPQDAATKNYVDTVAQGLDAKASCVCATTANITLSGTQTIDGIAVTAGQRVLVKNQSAPAQNGIYVASAGAWSRATDMDVWSEVPNAFTFVETGSTQADTGWVCTADAGGTLGTTAITWTQFNSAGSYTAGTGLTLSGTQFSITNTGTAGTYGSATQTPVLTTNAQGQVTSVTNTTITPAVGSITGLGTGVSTFLATPSSANLAAAVTDETGSGSLVFATSPTLVTPILGTPQSGNFSTGTFTWPTFNQNTTGSAGSVANALSAGTGLSYATGTTFDGSVARTLNLANTTVAAGSYTNASISVDAQGRLTSASSGTTPVTSVSGSGVISSSGGTTPTISISQATTSTSGYLSSTDWNTFNNKGSGTVTSVSVASANGFTGTSSGGATPALTLATSVTGVIKGNGTAISAATAGTDYSAGTSALATGILKSTTATGALSIAVAADFPILNQNTTGSAASATTATTATNATNVAVTNDTTTNATYYPAFVSNNTGNLGVTVSSTKLKFNPSTGALTASQLVIAP